MFVDGVIPRLLACLLCATLIFGCDSAEDRAAKHYENGLALIADGDAARAEIEFRNVLRIDPDHVGAAEQIVRLAEDEGDVATAQAHLQIIVQADPENVFARLRMARYALLTGRLDDAARHIAVASKNAPDDPDVLSVDAALALARGDAESARTKALRALGIDPAHVGATVLLARERSDAGALAEALAIADAALVLTPDSRLLNFLRLRMLHEMGDRAATGEQLGRMVDLRPGDLRVREALALWHLEEGESDVALAILRAGVEHDTADTGAGLALARHTLAIAGPDAARETLGGLIEQSGGADAYRVALAEIEFGAGLREEAVARLRDVAASASDAGVIRDVNVLLARFLIAMGRTDEAAEVVGTVLAADSRDAEALAMRASQSIGAGAFDSAITDARAGLTESPDSITLMLLEVEALDAKGLAELAADRLQAAAEASGYQPGVVMRYVDHLMQIGRAGMAEQVLGKALAARAEPVPELLLALGNVRLARRDWRGVEQAAAALRDLPGMEGAAEGLSALALTGQERLEEAIARLEALHERSASAWPLFTLFSMHLRAGEPDKALALADTILAETPGNAAALVLRGIALDLSGRTEEAEAALRAAISAAPQSEFGHSVLIRFLIAGQRIEDAAAAARASVRSIPDNSALQLLLGGLMERLGEIGAAIEAYRAAHEAERGSLVALNNYLSLLADHRADDLAVLEESGRLAERLRASDVPEFQDTYGWIRYLRGDYDAALAALEPAAAARPDNPWILYHLAMTQVQLGNTEGARANLDRIAALTEAQFPRIDTLRTALDTATLD